MLFEEAIGYLTCEVQLEACSYLHGISLNMNHSFIPATDGEDCESRKSSILNNNSFGSCSRGELPAGYGDLLCIILIQSLK